IFQRLRSIAKLGPMTGPCQPRIYDLRHTFAVHSIAQWKRHGMQVDRTLPLLASYMGNVDLTAMDLYLQLTPEHFRGRLRKLNLHTVKASEATYQARRHSFHESRRGVSGHGEFGGTGELCTTVCVRVVFCV